VGEPKFFRWERVGEVFWANGWARSHLLVRGTHDMALLRVPWERQTLARGRVSRLSLWVFCGEKRRHTLGLRVGARRSSATPSSTLVPSHPSAACPQIDATHTRAAAAGDGEGGGWAELPDELLAKVLELLQAAGQARGLGFSQASATVRLVCAAWKAVHDALVMRLVLKPQTTDEAMGMLVRRFPAVVSLEMKRKQSDYINRALLTNEGMRAVIK
jgi:hypothetical protein